MVEIGGTVNLTDNHYISFKMDTIMQGPNGIISLEHKTGSSAWNWDLQWYLSMQVGTYSHVLNCLYKPEDVRGVILDGMIFKKTKDHIKKDNEDPFRHFDFREVPIYLSKEAMNQWLNNTIWWLDMIKYNFNALADCSSDSPAMNAFPMNTTSCTNWSGCQYHDLCRAWGNPLQNIEHVPIGFEIDFWNPLEEKINLELDV